MRPKSENTNAVLILAISGIITSLGNVRVGFSPAINVLICFVNKIGFYKPIYLTTFPKQTIPLDTPKQTTVTKSLPIKISKSLCGELGTYALGFQSFFAPLIGNTFFFTGLKKGFKLRFLTIILTWDTRKKRSKSSITFATVARGYFLKRGETTKFFEFFAVN